MMSPWPPSKASMQDSVAHSLVTSNGRIAIGVSESKQLQWGLGAHAFMPI